MSLELWFPAILFFSLIGIGVSLATLRSSANRREKQEIRLKWFQDGLYNCSQNLEYINKLIEKGEILSAIRCFYNVKGFLDNLSHESFSSIEWKNYFSEIKRNLKSYEDFFNTHHLSVLAAYFFEKTKNSRKRKR